MLSMGILAGLAAMFCWGVADFLQSIPIRKIGSAKTMFTRSILTIALLLPIACCLFLKGELSISIDTLAIIFGASAIYSVGYYLFMRGFEIGNISVVCPISSAYSIITVLLALVLLGEQLPFIQMAAVGIMMLGVVLTSTDMNKLREIHSVKGIREALGAMLLWGINYFILGFVSKEISAYSLFFSVMLIQSLLFLIISTFNGGKVKLKDFDKRIAGIFISHSLIVNFGWAAFIYGISNFLVSLVVPISSLLPSVAVLLALIFYKEKLVPNQFAGILLILAGLFMVSI